MSKQTFLNDSHSTAIVVLIILPSTLIISNPTIMKTPLISLLFLVAASICVVSCGSSTYIPPQHHSNNYVDNAATDVELRNTSFNQFELTLLGNPIEYEINIASVEGANLLKGLTLQQAKQKAIWNACSKYNCAVIFRPDFDCLTQDGRVLRVTMRGTPANFKNLQKNNSGDNRHIEVNINTQ